MEDYRHTLNLPKTAFPMKANLPVKEPERLESWDQEGLYAKQRALRKGQDKFVLHDGPPYANGDIHAGTALNKIVKDMINRFWTLSGKDVPYVPGWDTHGLPIEMRALKSLGVSQHQIDPLELRRECARVARHYIAAMGQQFQRLGVLGDFPHAYVTLEPTYEGAELHVFAAMVDHGLVYRDLKAVYWCPHCETALAEGEIEYKSHRSDAIYVAFSVANPGNHGLPEKTRAVIWTTTPWTIPANVAIALHPEITYVVVETSEGPLLVALELRDEALSAMGLTAGEEKGRYVGKQLEGVVTRHPYLGHEVPLILGDYVTAESGTGLVHTAPGHGVEDFDAAKGYGLPVVQPLDSRGRYVEGTPLVAGLFYEEANPVVIEKLKETEALMHADAYDHQYAYCWRCKNPVIYRATQQWFMSIDPIRQALTDATRTVRWDPAWGGDRLRGMIADRQDWCLSRQRVWGLPIPAFYCEGCGASILDANLVRHVADIVAREGSDSWWIHGADYFLPEAYACPHCGGQTLRQERDIFDVWLDSGSSQAAVLQHDPALSWPADLVMEGNDQYRGWFNSLLTTGVATRGEAPYRMVLTHGMVLDKSGQEMHKSLGNTVDPMALVDKYGSDILRLWVASADYRGDVRISDDLMRQLSESYRKIRNTFRFLLGNLTEYVPEPVDQVEDPINRWAVHLVGQWLREAEESYRRYQFHTMVHGLTHLMTIDLSSLYFDVIKDRLYTLAPQDPLRRETQAVLYYILQALVRAVAPVLVFTAEEVYQYAPRAPKDPDSVHLTTWIGPWDIGVGADEEAEMRRLLGFRDVVLKALEVLRADKVIGNSLEAEVILTLPEDEPSLDDQALALLTEMTLAASVVAERGETLTARALKTARHRCERCWRYTEDATEGGICGRCQQVIGELGV